MRFDSLYRLFTCFVLAVALGALAAPADAQEPPAQEPPAQEPPAQEARTERTEESAENECDGGPSNKQWMFSLGGTLLGTILVGAVGTQTLARSLASGGYRQGASNMAGAALGAFVGGIVGAGLMAATPCGVGNVPGFVGLASCGIGFLVLLFSILTGKRR